VNIRRGRRRCSRQKEPRTFLGQRSRCSTVVFLAVIHRRQPAPDHRPGGEMDQASTCKHWRVTGFEPGEKPWIDRLGTLRNVVRQEMIARQIAPLAGPGIAVLDVGCGQGTQALRLSSAGCRVTAIDPSAELLGLCSEAAIAGRLDIELLQGRIEDLGELCGNRIFDLICCHGLMMYLDDWVQAVRELSARLATAGRLSVTFRNGHALAMRPGLRGNWAAALSAFHSAVYVNELGLPARANRTDEIEAALTSAGLRPVAWYGVRVLTDAIAVDTPPPDVDSLALLLDAEEQAGATEPYKWTASQLHVIAEPTA
jgi:S-adenosylmethionine-dependent methyltransferase